MDSCLGDAVQRERSYRPEADEGSVVRPGRSQTGVRYEAGVKPQHETFSLLARLLTREGNELAEPEISRFYAQPRNCYNPKRLNSQLREGEREGRLIQRNITDALILA